MMDADGKSVVRKVVIVVLIVFGMLCAGIAFVPDEQLEGFVSCQVCEDMVSEFAKRPSSVEINNTKVYRQQLTLDEVKEQWRQALTDSEVIEDVVGLATDFYQDGGFEEKLYVSVDYTAENEFGGASRSEFLCAFRSTFFEDTRLKSVTFGGRDYDFKDLSLHRPKGINLIGRLRKATVFERLRVIASLFFPAGE